MTSSIFWLFILAVAYLTWALRLEHKGPFNFKNIKVVSPDDTVRDAGLFDVFRNLFGAYEVHQVEKHQVWRMKSYLMVWSCPFCLSFWVQLPLNYFYYDYASISVFQAILMLFSTPLLCGIINLGIDGLINLVND